MEQGLARTGTGGERKKLPRRVEKWEAKEQENGFWFGRLSKEIEEGFFAFSMLLCLCSK